MHHVSLSRSPSWFPGRERREGVGLAYDSPGSRLPQAPSPGTSPLPVSCPRQHCPPSWRHPRHPSLLPGELRLAPVPEIKARGVARPGSRLWVRIIRAQSKGLVTALASLFCPPDTSWFKGRQPVSARKGVTVSADGRALHIERARVSDAGSYRCVATNVAGSTELQYGLRVNGELPGDCRGPCPESCPSVHLSVSLFVHPSFHPSIHPSSVLPSTHPFVPCLSIHPSIILPSVLPRDPQPCYPMPSP